MNYYYDEETKEFLFENNEKIEDYPSTEIDINFNLAPNTNQIFDGQKWKIVYDYRKSNVYKKDGTKVYKKLGQKLNEDEIISKDDSFNVTPNLKNEKQELKYKINGFLSSTDKYFNGHPPKYKGDIEKLKRYREYLYQFTEKEDWYEKKLIEYEEF